MNPPQEEAWSCSKKAVRDCKRTSPGLMFLTCFCFRVARTLPPVQPFFKYFGSRDREPRSTKVSGVRLFADAFVWDHRGIPPSVAPSGNPQTVASPSPTLQPTPVGLGLRRPGPRGADPRSRHR